MNFFNRFFKYTTLIQLGLTFFTAVLLLVMSCIEVDDSVIAYTLKVIFAPGSFFLNLSDLGDFDLIFGNLFLAPIVTLVSSMMWAAVLAFIIKLASNKDEEESMTFKLGTWGIALIVNLSLSIVFCLLTMLAPMLTTSNGLEMIIDSPVLAFLLPIGIFALIPSSLPLFICFLLAAASNFSQQSASAMLLPMAGFCVAAFSWCIVLACAGMRVLWTKIRWLFFVVLGVLVFAYSITALLIYIEYKDSWEYSNEYDWDSEYDYTEPAHPDDYEGDYEGDYDEGDYVEEDESDFTYDTDEAKSMFDYVLDYIDLPNTGYLQIAIGNMMSWAHNSYSGEYDGNQEKAFKAIRQFSRDSESLNDFYDTYSSVFYAAVSKSTYENTVLKSYVDGLLKAYDDITAHEEYKSRLNTIYNKANRWNDTYIQTKHYNLIKDLVSDEMAEKFSDSDHSDLVFLYTFWARRYAEDNIDKVHDILVSIQAHYAN